MDTGPVIACQKMYIAIYNYAILMFRQACTLYASSTEETVVKYENK